MRPTQIVSVELLRSMHPYSYIDGKGRLSYTDLPFVYLQISFRKSSQATHPYFAKIMS